MAQLSRTWDYLIITAANEMQAAAYEVQLRQRVRDGRLSAVRHCMVIADIEGLRIGSGGSTLHCLAEVLHHQRPASLRFTEAEAILSVLRILIVHAGGDSRRLPAYSHCGKMFVPIPDPAEPAKSTTLFDQLVPSFLALPIAVNGQIVVAAGDALILFDASKVQLQRAGITALACFASAEEASRHGVFCAEPDGSVRRFLQKPSIEQQVAAGAMNGEGKSALDVGVMSFDARSAISLLRTFFNEGIGQGDARCLTWKAEAQEAIKSGGLDLYREICCGLGYDTSVEEYLGGVRASGSTLDSSGLVQWFPQLHTIPFHVEILSRCRFLHFGTTRQLISSGLALVAKDECLGACFILNSRVSNEIASNHVWIEGCSLEAEVSLGGFNALIGVDAAKPLTLGYGACVDISAGTGRVGEATYFLRIYHIDDSFKETLEEGGSFCGWPMQAWFDAVGLTIREVWPEWFSANQHTLWNAQVFPAIRQHSELCDWLWFFDPDSATSAQKHRFVEADRYSCSEIALRLNQSEFYRRRATLNASASRADG